MATTGATWTSSSAGTGKASGAVDYYLQLPNIPGEATATGFEKQIAVSAFTMGFEQTLNIGSQSSGAGAGKITYLPFSIEKHYDLASTKLFLAAAAGTPMNGVIFSIVKTGSGSADGKSAPKAYLKVTLNLCFVKSISVQTLDAYPVELVSFEYGAIKFEYSVMNVSTGALTTGNMGSWDRTKNVSF